MLKNKDALKPRMMNLPMALAALLSAIGFTIFIHSLNEPGLKKRTEKLLYLDYELSQKGRDRQGQSIIYLPIQPRFIEPSVFEYSLNIKCDSLNRLVNVTDICIDLSIPKGYQYVYAELVFLNSKTGEEEIRFASGLNGGACQDGQLKLTRVSEYFIKRSKKMSLTGILKIRCAKNVKLGIPLFVSEEKHQTAFFEIEATDEIKNLLKLNSGQLTGCVLYSSETASTFTKAQLLAFSWGLGITGQGVIFTLTLISLALWLLGVVLIFSYKKLVHNFQACIFLRGFGFICIFSAICIIFAFLFPPFRGPDEVHHFSGYAEVIQKTPLLHDALKLSNLGAFYRIHRMKEEKISNVDTLLNNHFDWPKDVTNPYILSRSPLGIAVWKFLGNFLPDSSAGHAMLSLRIASGMFVSICMLISLLFCGSQYPNKTIPVFPLIPFVLIPSIAYYSTAISNYPILIGGYAIQVIALGRLMMSLQDVRIQLEQVGAVLGLGISISLCSADNAIAAMAFWALALPGFLVARRSSDMIFSRLIYETNRLLGSCIVTTLLFCAAVSFTSMNHSFLPQMVASQVSELLSFNYAPLVSQIVFLLLFFSVVSLNIIIFWILNINFKKYFTNFHSKIVMGMILILIVVFLIMEFRIPEIDLSRGGGTNSLIYALLVLSSFIDGFIPGSADPMVSDSFWRQLGWLDTTLPLFIRELLRYACGFGLVLFLSACFSQNSNRSNTFFYLSTTFGLFGCVASVGFLYFHALYNVNSRYILIGYIFAAALAIEGYRRILFSFQGRKFFKPLSITFIITLSILIMTCSWVTILNRFF